MVDSIPGRIAGLLILFLLAASPSLAEAAQASKGETTKTPRVAKEDWGLWFLAGREGGCAATSILGRKGPEYRDIQNPQQLVEKLQSAGHKAEMKEFQAGVRSAVEVKAPSAGLAVLFVRKEFCEKIGADPESKNNTYSSSS